MNSTIQKNWCRPCSDVIDQRQLPLPALWATIDRASVPCKKSGNGVFASGKDRVMANAVINLVERGKG